MSEINPFKDYAAFMLACDQTVGVCNVRQSNLYLDLIKEEFQEFNCALPDSVDELDGIVDTIVTLIGYAHSVGYDIEGAWREVLRSNMAKVGPDGKVRLREDGKILKPEGWTPPDLTPFLGG